jgi:hypothetical protein
MYGLGVLVYILFVISVWVLCEGEDWCVWVLEGCRYRPCECDLMVYYLFC